MFYDVLKGERKATKEEFTQYLKIQAWGGVNMLSRDARSIVGIDIQAYNYIVQHYEELEEEYEVSIDSPEIVFCARIMRKVTG